MKSLICPFDAKSGVLCAKCESKLESGGITHDDVKAAIKLARLADKDQQVDKFTLLRGTQVDDDFVLVLRSPDVIALRGDSRLADKIENEFGQKVWFVESEASDRRFVEGLLDHLKVMSVNLFWMPDGSKLTKVVVSGDAKRARVNIEKVVKIAKAVRNIDLLIEFENR
ncbi:MAG: transcription elongation factor NusA [Thermoproteota archaeon]